MSDDLVLNLLFSATFEPMHSIGLRPPREIRIAHNHARRLLAEQHGFRKFQKLAELVQARVFWQRYPAVCQAVLGGILLWPFYAAYPQKR